MTDTIFRQYDIRGIVGSELIVSEVYSLTRSIACYFKEQMPDIKAIAVGADGRIHSQAIKEEVCRALQDVGLDVLFIGMCPTPVLYFSLFQLPVQAGLMITASHNGKEYNGLKICLNKESVWGAQIQKIKEKYKQGAFQSPIFKRGEYYDVPMVEAYITWLSEQFAPLKKMELKVVVDCGNGAAGTVMPLLCKTMEWNSVRLLYSDVDGTYPNHEADPTQEENMVDVKNILATTDTALGIGLDGDADRMVPMTKQGELIFGDKLLSVFALDIAQKIPQFSVVYDIKCSSGLPEVLLDHGITPSLSPTGHSIIKMNMKKSNALLAGELSCHFFFADRYFGYDDGIYALVRLFEILHTTKKSLEELLTVFPKKIATKEFRFSCPEGMQTKIMHHVYDYFVRNTDADIITVDGIRASLFTGWGMMRPSNTQPVLCARFEAATQEDIVRIQKEFIAALAPFYEELYMRTLFAMK